MSPPPPLNKHNGAELIERRQRREAQLSPGVWQHADEGAASGSPGRAASRPRRGAQGVGGGRGVGVGLRPRSLGTPLMSSTVAAPQHHTHSETGKRAHAWPSCSEHASNGIQHTWKRVKGRSKASFDTSGCKWRMEVHSNHTLFYLSGTDKYV